MLGCIRKSNFIIKTSISVLSKRSFSVPQPNECPEVKCNSIFINNQWVDACSGKTFETVNPANCEVITQVAHGAKEDVDKAVDAARTAFQLGSPWRILDASKRGFLLHRLADLINRDRHYIASLETLDGGKPYKMSYTIDVPAASQVLRYFAGWADKNQGLTVPTGGPLLAFTRHEPIGVCGLIIAWNFPLLLWAWKVGPAIATGNTVVLKPAEQTPLTALYVAQLSCEAGFPPGVINVVPGFGDVGQALVEHQYVNKVAFTGSNETGKEVMKKAAESVKRVSLELGGKSPHIIMDDCDLDLAVENAHFGSFFNMGQCCCAGSRVYVHENIYDSFVQKSIQRAQCRSVGDPFDSGTEQGPQITEAHMEKILKYIENGEKQGAKLETGGCRKGDSGYFIEPTVFTSVTEDMEIAREEIFGPVQCIFKFCTLEEAIERANDSRYGLAAGICSKNIDTITTAIQSLQAGTVWVNTYNILNPEVPFGGYKESGFGRDLGEYGLRAFTQEKSVYIKVSRKNS